jgi:tetratricopeptide (TPR) repeat protein
MMMTCKLFCLTASVCALAVASLLAEDEEKAATVKEVSQAAQAERVKREREDPRAVQDRQRYEEIEIMRRILNDGLRRVARARTNDGSRAVNESPLGNLSGSVFLDFDNDGQQDIVFANPFQSPQDYHSWLGTRRNDPHHQGVPPIETVEGLYLKGHGVVYTAGLLVHYLDAVKPSPRPAQKPLSEWERVRKEIRGEKAETSAQPLTHARENVADAILRMLAENGHNFSSLAQEESVTVAVTLRQGMDCALCHKMDVSHTIDLSYKDLAAATRLSSASAATTREGERQRPSYFSPGNELDERRQQLSDAANKSSSSVGRSLSEQAATQINRGRPNTESENQTLLGDLQMKQGRYKEAVEAYRKALEDLGKATDNEARLAEKLLQAGQADKGTLQGQVLTTELAAKLAQASLAQGDDDQALKALEQLGAQQKRIESLYKKILEKKGRAQGGQSAAKNTQIELPAKLIISAPKRLLDEVGTGKMSLAEFKKAASIEFLTFPGTKSSGQAKP